MVDRYFTYVNYFDSSIANDSTLLANIQEANQFASNMYAKYFGLPFKIVDATRLDVVETCPGNDQPCIESCDTDGSKCSSNHHKGGLYISNYLYGRSREENHVYTLWTNRPEKTYCHYDSDTGVHDQVSWIAVVYGYRPVIQFMTLFGENSDQVKACMTLNLVHETAHTFGMGDVYNDVGHDVSNATVCVMEKFDMNTSVEFYELVANGLVSPFCSSCMEELSPYVETCYHAANVN